MKNICFFLGNFQTNGGIGRSTSIVVNALSNMENYKITTVSYFDSNKPLLYDISSKVNMQFLYKSDVSMAKAILFDNAVKKLSDILKANHIDVVVACGAIFFPLAILSAKRCGIKCCCWEHTNPQITSDYRFQGVARKMAVKFADKMVVLTKAAEQFYRYELDIKKEKIIQIYNPVSKFAAVNDKYNKESKKIISVGRLSYPKNFSLLVDIAAEVLPKYPEWSWDIYGSGEEYDGLLKKIKSKGLEGRVNLMGQVNNLYERYGEYAFQVMTSRYEGFPMSLIEGAANKLPLVSFDIETGPKEIIEDGENGFLIEPENAPMMIKKIELLIENMPLREKMADQSFKLNERFSLDSVIERWCELWQVIDK